MSMSKRKRDHRCSASSSQGDESQPAGKRRREALLSYFVTAIKEDLKQELRSVVAETLREVIKEELQHCQPVKPIERAPPRSIERGDSRNLQLHFKTRLSLPLYTGKQIEGEKGAPICIALIDTNTGNVAASGPEASVKLDVVVLEGDFKKDNSNDWTREEFEDYLTREREGKAPLLTGDLHVALEGGVGVLGKLRFTDNSSWNRSKMYRIGLKVASGYCEGVRIREAITEALRVKDHRGESYEKHYPAKPDDEVWRLKKIAKGGSYHKRLTKERIFVVEDFLRHFVRDPKSLRNMLGGGMTDNKYYELIDHAKSCVQSGKLYLYFTDDVMGHGVVFDIIGQLKGFVADGSFCSADSLPPELKEQCDNLVRRAYHNWDNVSEFNISSSSIENSVSGTFQPAGAFPGRKGFSDSSDCYLSSFHDSAPTETPGSSQMVVEGYDETIVGGSLINLQNNNLSFAVQNQPMHSINHVEIPMYHNSAQTEPDMAPAPPPAFQGHSASSPHRHEGPGFTEELPSSSLQDDHRMESPMFDSDTVDWLMSVLEDKGPKRPPPRRGRTKSAVASWLRIKTVFRWGFFVRRKVSSKVCPTIEQLS